ncbi:Ldh family oxidoreductase [Virgibacillus ndiopensis]|uniref:Ldh family oxidoreductase n=1 Tax=Virgibacillus ndiopensis TaxID=2004408 RepID=UPI00159BBE75|nr:Ldh family oxidoreductase [Virgibacillus ndiopensis]
MIKKAIRVPHKVLETFITDIFIAAGVDESDALIVAKHLVLANLRGVDSHGVSRTDIYTRRLDRGIVNKVDGSFIEKETSASALIDGENSLGIVLATKGIKLAVDKAKQSGIGIVGIKNSNHCGMLADYTSYAAKNDCVCIAVTNAPANMAPWGGKERFFGTNPFSYGIPAGRHQNIVFDMATSKVARGKILLAQKDNQNIPIGWAITKEGKPTQNPSEAIDGLVLPVGGPKGYGLTFLVESLSAIFTGAAFGPHIGDLYRDLSKTQNVGQFFLVFRADLLQTLDQFKNRIDEMIDKIREVPLIEGVEKIYLPGEIETEKQFEREVNGIPLSKEVVDELSLVARRYGVKTIF